MNKYNAAQSVYLSLYSADFYRDVAQNWQGTGIKYLTGLLMLTCIPVSAKIYMEAGETARVLGSITVSMPSVFIENGKLSIDKTVPYRIKDPKKGVNDVVLFDTNNSLQNYADQHALIVVTKDSVITGFRKKDNKAPSTIKLSGVKSFTMTPSDFKNWLELFPLIAAGLVYTLCVVSGLLVAIFNALVYAAIARKRKMQDGSILAYQSIFRLVSIALTPLILVDSLHRFIWLTEPLPGLSPIVIGVFFVTLALKAVTSVPIDSASRLAARPTKV